MQSGQKVDLKHFGIAARIFVVCLWERFALIYQLASEYTFQEYACIGLVCVALWLSTVSVLAYVYRFKAGLVDEGLGMCVGVILLSCGGIAFIYVLFTIFASSITGNGFPPFRV